MASIHFPQQGSDVHTLSPIFLNVYEASTHVYYEASPRAPLSGEARAIVYLKRNNTHAWCNPLTTYALQQHRHHDVPRTRVRPLAAILRYRTTVPPALLPASTRARENAKYILNRTQSTAVKPQDLDPFRRQQANPATPGELRRVYHS